MYIKKHVLSSYEWIIPIKSLHYHFKDLILIRLYMPVSKEALLDLIIFSWVKE